MRGVAEMLTYLKPIFDLKYLTYVIVGTIVYSIGFNVFILPCNLYNGGFIGIVQLLLYFVEQGLGIHLEGGNYNGIVYFLLNIPLIYLAMRRFGSEFLVRTIFCISAYSVTLGLMPVPGHAYLPDMITACIAGGVFCGIGCGLTLMSKGSGGGEGILGLLLMQRYKNMSIGTVFNIINLFVFASCLYIYDIATAVYSIFFNVITSMVLDKVYLPSITIAMFIVTKKENVAQMIFDTVHRGVTKIKGVGAYSGEDTNILLTVVSKAEAGLLRKVITEYDKDVFIIEEHAGITGNFQRRL